MGGSLPTGKKSRDRSGRTRESPVCPGEGLLPVRRMMGGRRGAFAGPSRTGQSHVLFKGGVGLTSAICRMSPKSLLGLCSPNGGFSWPMHPAGALGAFFSFTENGCGANSRWTGRWESPGEPAPSSRRRQEVGTERGWFAEPAKTASVPTSCLYQSKGGRAAGIG